MKLVLEGRRHAKVSAAAANSPKQICIIFIAGRNGAPVSQDNVDRQQIVESQPIFAHQPAEPAAEGEPADAGGRNYTAGYR
jgi:hypothetical protein